MQSTTDHDDPSLSELLYALILALTPFIESILADTTRPQSPALLRLARTLRALRAFATLLGFTTPAITSSIDRTAPARSTRARPARRLNLAQTLPLSPRPPSIAFTIAPEPARTLEL